MSRIDPRRRRLAVAAASSLAPALMPRAAAQPSTAPAPGAAGQAAGGAPLRLLVGFAPGGTIDVVARLLAERMKDDLGGPVVVENRPGAGGQIAAQQLRQAAADGRTLLLSPDHTMVMLPLTVREPGFAPTDFAPVAQVARYPGGLAVPAASGVRTLADFYAWARANPAQASVGIPAPASVPQFLVHQMSRDAGVALTSVPYRGSAPLVQDLLGSQIGAGTTALGDFVEHHAAGRLRVIGVMDQRRSAALPEVPTFIEQGQRLDWEYWLGLFAPRGTPAATIERLGQSVSRALAAPEVRERMQRIVFEPAWAAPATLADKVRAGGAYWAPVVRGSGWVPQ